MDLKQLKLNALLEVTQAINSNMPEESLYKIFYFTCISTMKVQRLALVVCENETMLPKIEHGFKLSTDDLQHLETAAQDYRSGLVEEIISLTHKNRILAYILLTIDTDVEDRKDFVSFIKTVANIIMVAIENKRFARREIEQQAFKKEMEIASTVQNMLFPKKLPKKGKIVIDAFYLPHKSVGGDYYDYICISENLQYACIADVSGKGMPAALLMSNFQACLRTMVHQTSDLKVIVEELNQQLLYNSQGEYFVTFFIAEINFETGIINYVNSGHNPIFYKRGNIIEELHTGSTILGAFDKLPSLEIGETRLEKGACLLFYTDGVSETKNTSDEEWGEERLKSCFLNYSPENDLSVIDKVLKEVDNFRGGRYYIDDLTLMVCSF